MKTLIFTLALAWSSVSIAKPEVMNLRIKISKYYITKTEQGPKVKFEPVCEINSQTKVKDLTQGGITTKETLGQCESKYREKPVLVNLTGMVYDNTVADFSDEDEAWTRNFFAHLSLSSSEIIFGLGDFNLDTSRDPNLKHLSSSLSVDPKAGGGDKVREGFTARIRYTPN